MKKRLRYIARLLCVLAIAAAIALAGVGCGRSHQPSPGEPSGGAVTTPDSGESTTPDGGESTTPEPPDGGGEEQDPPAWALHFSLPDGDEAYRKLVALYGGEEKVFLLRQGAVARMPCPQGETVTLNMTYEPNIYAKRILADCIEEFNEVFAVINPNYRFAVRYAPTEADFAAKFSVRMSVSDNLPATDTSEVLGLAHIGYAANFTELCDFGITLHRKAIEDARYLMTTFKHEMMHLLGAGDAYKNVSATRNTVMQSYTVGGYHFLSASDVAFLDILYRNPALDGNAEEIAAFIADYEEETTHDTRDIAALVYGMLIESVSPQDVLAQATAKGYADLTAFAATIEGGIAYDPDFCKEDFRFAELSYTEPPAATYFGSYDASEAVYRHGTQKGTLGSSQSVNNPVCYAGILYIAPNGNLYTLLVRTGDFIVAFRLSAYYYDLPSLALSLWFVGA